MEQTGIPEAEKATTGLKVARGFSSVRYCSREDELRKNPEAYYWIKRIANGNSDAEELMWTLWDFEHMLDDLVDRDRLVTVEEAGKAFIDLVAALTFNGFYTQHAHSIFPLLVSATNRWIDGTLWATSTKPNRKQQAVVVKCGDIDLYLHIAFLAGGWQHMRDVREARSYDLD